MKKKIIGIRAVNPLVVVFFVLSLAACAFASNDTLEERVARLEENNRKMQHELTRAQDVIEIMKLQGRYEAIHCTDEGLGWMLFADRPDTSKEITAERVVGFENIKKGYTGMGGQPPQGGANASTGKGEPNPGDRFAGVPDELKRYYDISAQGQKYTVHPVATPVIEVAADGKTAKATYTSFGFEGDMWCYGKYANDYIKIDGKWYIWHMKWLRGFKTPFGISWNDQTVDQIYEFTKGEKDENGNPKLNPEVNYDYLLSPIKKLRTITAPKPYETWTKADENGGWWKKETVTP